MKIFDREAGFQCEENFLEDGDTVGNPRVASRCDDVRGVHSGGIMRGERAVEVNPVDSPGAFVVGAVGMRAVVRKDEELTVGNVVASVAYSVPSAPFDAVNENELTESLIAFAEMMASRGVVADVGDVERRAKRVALQHVENHLGDDDGALTAKTFFYAYHSVRWGKKCFQMVNQVLMVKIAVR